MGTTLDYSPRLATSRERSAKLLLSIAKTAVVVLGAWIVLTGFTFWTSDHETDAVTGSERTTVTLPFGIPWRQVTRPSALERRLVQRGITWTPIWKHRGQNGSSLLPGSSYCALGDRPVIDEATGVLPDFAAAATDDELRAFAQTMQTGTEAEQKSTVKAICDRFYP